MMNCYCYLTARKRDNGTQYLNPEIPVFQIDNLGLNEATIQWQELINPRNRVFKNISVKPKELVLYIEGIPSPYIHIGDYLSFKIYHPMYGYSAGYVTAIESERKSAHVFTKYTVFLPMPYFLISIAGKWGEVTPSDFEKRTNSYLYDNGSYEKEEDNHYIYKINKYELDREFPRIIHPHNYYFYFKNKDTGETETVSGYFRFLFNNGVDEVIYPSYRGMVFECFSFEVSDSGLKVKVNNEEIVDAERVLLPYFSYLQQYKYDIYFYALKETLISVELSYSGRRFV